MQFGQPGVARGLSISKAGRVNAELVRCTLDRSDPAVEISSVAEHDFVSDAAGLEWPAISG
ncbi:hypothetical protein CQ10_34285 [Bradyrhizobium valentinum]|nr:hypothetical protein CQ10_34285 [Bradyrhizobium valentinum]